MRKILLLIWIITMIACVGNTEELIPFSLICNLDNADLILQAEIIDVKGNLQIEHFHKGNLSGTEIINIKEFSIEANTEIDPGFPKKIGQHVILFISTSDSNSEFRPSFFSWYLSTLWIYGNKIAAVHQPVIPGGYCLRTFYEDENELTSKIDNWLLLESILDKSDEIKISKHRVNYLTELLTWHPFRDDIVHKLSREENVDLNAIMEHIWFLFNFKAGSSSKQYTCWLQKKENYHQLIFMLLKRHDENGYKNAILKILGYCKRSIDNMESKYESINEEFVIEFLIFVNKYPIDQWDQEKEEIATILTRNDKFYNGRFLILLRNEIKL